MSIVHEETDRERRLLRELADLVEGALAIFDAHKGDTRVSLLVHHKNFMASATKTQAWIESQFPLHYTRADDPPFADWLQARRATITQKLAASNTTLYRFALWNGVFTVGFIASKSLTMHDLQLNPQLTVARNSPSAPALMRTDAGTMRAATGLSTRRPYDAIPEDLLRRMELEELPVACLETFFQLLLRLRQQLLWDVLPTWGISVLSRLDVANYRHTLTRQPSKAWALVAHALDQAGPLLLDAIKDDTVSSLCLVS